MHVVAQARLSTSPHIDLPIVEQFDMQRFRILLLKLSVWREQWFNGMVRVIS